MGLVCMYPKASLQMSTFPGIELHICMHLRELSMTGLIISNRANPLTLGHAQVATQSPAPSYSPAFCTGTNPSRWHPCARLQRHGPCSAPSPPPLGAAAPLGRCRPTPPTELPHPAGRLARYSRLCVFISRNRRLCLVIYPVWNCWRRPR